MDNAVTRDIVQDPYKWLERELGIMLWQEEISKNGWDKIECANGMVNADDWWVYRIVKRLVNDRYDDLPERFRNIPLFADKDRVYISLHAIHEEAKEAATLKMMNKLSAEEIEATLERLMGCLVCKTYKDMQTTFHLIDTDILTVGDEKYLGVKEAKIDFEKRYQDMLRLMRDEGCEAEQC